jgi:hypothetical protein
MPPTCSLLVKNFIERTEALLKTQLTELEPQFLSNTPEFEKRLIEVQAEMHSKVQSLIDNLHSKKPLPHF